MINIDRKVIKAVLELTDNYHDEMTQDAESPSILLIRDYSTVVKKCPVDSSAEDISESVQRLIAAGYLREASRWYGGFSFCQTSLLKHRRAFWIDRVSKKFVTGFLSGLVTGTIVTVLGGLLLSYLRARLGI